MVGKSGEKKTWMKNTQTSMVGKNIAEKYIDEKTLNSMVGKSDRKNTDEKHTNFDS